MNTTNNTQLNTNTITMTSLEIAEITGKKHKHITRDIRYMLVELDYKIDGSDLDHDDFKQVLDNRGYVSVYKLNENLSITLVSGYNTVMRKAIIDHLLFLKANVNKAQPQSSVDTLALMDRICAIHQQSLDIIQSAINPVNSPFQTQSTPVQETVEPRRSGLISNVMSGHRDEFELVTLTNLISEFGVDSSARKINIMLEKFGIIEKSRDFKTGAVINTLVDVYYGENIKKIGVPKSQPQYYRGKFSRMMDLLDLSILSNMA